MEVSARMRAHLMHGGLLALLLLIGTTSAAGGQEPDFQPTARPWFVTVSHYGKWATLAGAAGLITLSAIRRGEANDRLDRLDAFCTADITRCQFVRTPSGDLRYASDRAEAIFQEHVRLDRTAQGFLIGGQAGLITSGGMFLIDLIWDEDKPKNIPFTPFEVLATPRELGLAVRF